MKRKIAVLFLFAAVISACAEKDQGDDRLKEKAEIEGEASAKKQKEAEKAYLESRSREMEQDLLLKEKFFRAVTGTYVGSFKTEVGELQVKLKLIPSLPIFKTGRVRSLEEIVFELNNLHFNVQVVHWNASNNLSASGCVFSGIKPNLENGQINIAADNCLNVYWVSVAEKAFTSEQILKKPDEVENQAEAIAHAILSGDNYEVENLAVKMQGTNNAREFGFSVKRVSQ